MTDPTDSTAMPDSAAPASQDERLVNLVTALEPLMASINFYMGRNARTSVGRESVEAYERLRLALRRAQSETCHRCDDTAIDQEWKDDIARPCPLRNEVGHGIELPPEVIAYMTEQRDNDRARPHCRSARFEAELAALVSQENTGGEG